MQKLAAKEISVGIAVECFFFHNWRSGLEVFGWKKINTVTACLLFLYKASHQLIAINIIVERIRTPDSSSGISDQQIVGLSPGLDTCVLKQDT